LAMRLDLSEARVQVRYKPKSLAWLIWRRALVCKSRSDKP
jgi:hypothetical protein